MRRVMILLAVAATAAGGLARPADGEMWQGAKLTPVAPEPVYEFAQPPKFEPLLDAQGRRVKDHCRITFAAKAACDVAVVIESADGRIIRHIVYGVLGANAPFPLAPNSLEQSLVWDGKDDGGRYVKDAAACRARVSLGLNPTFDKVLGWHPKDVVHGGQIVGLAANPDGVYVLTTSCRNQLRAFDHNANYLRTLAPFRADLVEQPALNVPTRKVEGGRVVPQMGGIGGLQPFVWVGNPNCLTSAGDKLAMFTVGGPHDARRILRLRADGTTGGEPMDGARYSRGVSGRYASVQTSNASYMGPGHIALSPDGQWVYVNGMSMGEGWDIRGEPQPYRMHAVFRAAWDQTELIVSHDSFIGEVTNARSAGAGGDDTHLRHPEGLATDAAGNLYICDYGNNRVQVFSPAARLVRSIPIGRPHEIAVHQKTGAIYVLCYDPEALLGGSVQLVKLAGLADPKVAAEQKFAVPGGDGRVIGFTPIFCLDSWAPRPRVWMVHSRYSVRIYEEQPDGKFALLDDFEQDVRKAGLNPHVLGPARKNHLEADPKRNQLYYLRNGTPLRCDAEGPGRFDYVRFPSGEWEDMDIGTDGLLYMRALRYLARFDPDRARAAADGTVEVPGSAEVVFDYGEERLGRWARQPYEGVIPIAALPGANGFDTGIGVSPSGQIVSFMKNYRTYEGILWGRDAGKWVDSWGSRMKEEMDTVGYRPRTFPGRYINAAELVMRWDERGESTGEDLVPALPMPSCGIKMDRYGNIYFGIGARMFMPDGSLHVGGAVAKFPPDGGKMFGKGDVAKLDELPDRPAEFQVGGWGKMWSMNMLWAYPGLDQLHTLGGGIYPCLCATCRFDTDLFGRSFVPKAYAFTVGVIDTNGNRICEIGRYGNPESPAMKPGDGLVGIAHCSYLATDSDRWLYVNDSGNSRIIRVRLGYHAERIVPLK